MFEAAIKDEAALRASLAEADIAPTLMVLAQLSGDMAILDEVAPHIQGAWSFMESVPEPLKQKVRDRLVDVLKDYAATGRQPPAELPTATLQRIMTAGAGQMVPEEYIPVLLEETRLNGGDPRAVHWHHQPAAESIAAFKVVIIGAGFSGVCTAIRLLDLGLPFEIIEKNPDVGGTWLENEYPGCAVDTPNHFYSYSFNQNEGWTRHFSRRDELLAYIKATVEKYGLRKHIRFGNEVTSSAFDETTGKWSIALRDASGTSETIQASALITAVGQLNRPSIPPIPGMERFKGPLFHTAQWDRTVDLRGKRVAMIGTGASGMQTGPSIAPDVAHLTVFQRTPHWAVFNPNYHKEVSAGALWAIKHIPYYAEWMRFLLFWAGSDGFHATLRVDPSWPHQDRSLNEKNQAMRDMIVDYVRKELDGDEDLLAKVIPPYPPYGKRMLRDNYWYRMLKRPNVSLQTGDVAEITDSAIVMRDGSVHEVDVIILATGFQASKMLAPMEIKGRGGKTIRDVWGDDDPRAYLGITVPKFPNLFLIYGPNTNLAHGGSIIFHTECQVRYIMQALRHMVENAETELEVRGDAHDAYNELVDETHRGMVWAHPGVMSWYKNKQNRVTVTSPWRLLDYWALTKDFDPSKYQARQNKQAVAAE